MIHAGFIKKANTGSQGFTSQSSIWIAVAIETLVFIAIFFAVWFAKGLDDAFAGLWFSEYSSHWFDMDQYALLGHALINGELTLDLPVPEGLLNLSNPYDFDARVEAGSKFDTPIYWDHAYYNGAYYSYFGIIPALLLYVPYELITGEFLNTSVAVAGLGIFMIIAESYFVTTLSRCYFEKTRTIASVLLVNAMFFGGCNVMYLGFVPCFYSVPILASLICTFFGLSFWMNARNKVASAHGRAQLSKTDLFVGSFLMAMNLGCRPQFVLACFLAIPLFWNEIKRKRTLFSKRGIKETIAALAPFVIVVVPLCLYNYVRFGSIFNFGSSYNLTGFDMTTYSQTLGTTLLVLYCFLFQPVSLSFEFPFINVVDWVWPFSLIKTNPLYMIILLLPIVILFVYVIRGVIRALRYQMKQRKWVRYCFWTVAAILVMGLAGVAIYLLKTMSLSEIVRLLFRFAPNEPMFGGYFWLVPYALLVFVLPKAKSLLTKKGLWAFCWLALVFAFVVLLVDARTAGITQRYFADFGLYLMIVSALVLFSLLEQYKSTAEDQAGQDLLDDSLKRRKRLLVLISCGIAIAVILGGLSLLSPDRYNSIAEMNPELYETIKAPFNSE